MMEEYINLRVCDTTFLNVDGSGNTHAVFFKIKPTTSLSLLITAYCNRRRIPRPSYSFYYGECEVLEHNTPAELGILNEGIIYLKVKN